MKAFMSTGRTLGLASVLALGCGHVQANWSDQVQVAGSAIFELDMTRGDYLGDSIDMHLFEFYMAIDAQLSDRVSATVGLLYEEGDDDESTDFNVDEGYLTLELTPSTSLQLGLMAIPFGSYNTGMINDPFSLVLGEAFETGAAVHWADDSFAAVAYVFNGNIHEVGKDDSVNSFGLRVTAGSEDQNITFDYINNIGDADTYSGAPYPEENIFAELAGGISIAGHISTGDFTVDLEYMAALDPILVNPNSEVESLAVEVGMTLQGHCACAIGGAVQTSDNAATILPKTRISFGYTRPLFDELTLNTELYFDEDYDVNDGGTGDSGTGLLVQIAASF